MIKHLFRLWPTVLLVAWGFDFLFWKKDPGISFPVFILIILAGGAFLVWQAGLRPALRSLLLILPLGYFAVMAFIRLEPFTLALSYLFSFSLLALLASTLLGGRWTFYGLLDYPAKFLQVAGSALGGGLSAWSQSRQEVAEGPAVTTVKISWRRGLPALRGIIFALPVVLIFAGLLASADPIFARSLNGLIHLFRIERLPEYLFRALYILALAYTLSGFYLHALLKSQDERLIGVEKPLFAPFFGLTESVIILGSVDALFGFFVAIQVRYFFGGKENISLEGYTYSEYARRGFGELLAVALFSLLLFLGLSAIARREKPAQRWLFSALGAGLLALVAIILVSALQRLLLYEQAYGFSRLRTYTHVFMIWLGILLAVTATLEVAGKLRFFALAAVLAGLGFGATLCLLNVDGFIARQNIARAARGAELDTVYLGSLSLDTTPALVDLYGSTALPRQVRDEIGGALACQAAAIHNEGQAQPWQSFHWSTFLAERLLDQMDLSAYRVSFSGQGQRKVEVDGKERTCARDWWD